MSAVDKARELGAEHAHRDIADGVWREPDPSDLVVAGETPESVDAMWSAIDAYCDAYRTARSEAYTAKVEEGMQ